MNDLTYKHVQLYSHFLNLTQIKTIWALHILYCKCYHLLIYEVILGNQKEQIF